MRDPSVFETIHQAAEVQLTIPQSELCDSEMWRASRAPQVDFGYRITISMQMYIDIFEGFPSFAKIDLSLLHQGKLSM